ncbi:MAG TPA: CapA family protein [Longimicrobiales bacterium]|nr:CapA family protein [Longimicrobiales bacterium]
MDWITMHSGALPDEKTARTLVLLAAMAAGLAPDVVAQAPYRAASGTIELALVGDAIVSRPLSVNTEPEHRAMVEAIQGADAAFANLEIVFQSVDLLTPMVSDRESYMFADPALAADLHRVGFDLVSRANNHSLDYGWDGMRATSRALDAAGIAHAGVGENLALADAAAFADVAAGRVALISTASTFEDFQAARPQRRDIRATPGLNPLRHREITVLPRASAEALQGIAREAGERPADGDRFQAFGRTFQVGERPGARSEVDQADLDRILASVRSARSEADWVIVATHSHEGAGSREVPADFLVAYAHAAIDAGADVFVGTGPHVLRGIEIYKGRPIFYSLGNFAMENETVPFRPSAEYERTDLGRDARTTDYYDDRQRTAGGYFTLDPVYWESVIALPTFRGGALVEIRLLPLTLGFGAPRSQRGRPLRADVETGRKIIARLAELSAPFGTHVQERDGMGIVRLSADPDGRRPQEPENPEEILR